MLPGGRRRSFSIASPPHDPRVLELHVRRVAGGEFSAPLFDENTRGSPADHRGTAGTVHIPAAAHAPMLLVGGGTGLAPLLSILRHVLENGIERDMTALLGRAQRARSLCACRTRRTCGAVHRRRRGAAGRSCVTCRYCPSPPPTGGDAPAGCTRQCSRDIAILEQYDVYAAGPPAMIAAVRQEFAAARCRAEAAVLRLVRLRAGYASSANGSAPPPNLDLRPSRPATAAPSIPARECRRRRARRAPANAHVRIHRARPAAQGRASCRAISRLVAVITCTRARRKLSSTDWRERLGSESRVCARRPRRSRRAHRAARAPARGRAGHCCP